MFEHLSLNFSLSLVWALVLTVSAIHSWDLKIFYMPMPLLRFIDSECLGCGPWYFKWIFTGDSNIQWYWSQVVLWHSVMLGTIALDNILFSSLTVFLKSIYIPMVFFQNRKLLVSGVSIYKWELIGAIFEVYKYWFPVSILLFFILTDVSLLHKATQQKTTKSQPFFAVRFGPVAWFWPLGSGQCKFGSCL